MYVLFGMMVVGLGSWGVFAANNYLKPDGTPNFQELKSTKNGNKLTAEMWDNLMDGLSKMQQNWASNTTPWLEIPKGAVMAFNLETCPQWWKRFAAADGRFIMGTQGGNSYNGYWPMKNVGAQWGTASIKLNIGQLPAHSHYMFGSWDAETNEWVVNDREGTISPYSKTKVDDRNEWYAIRTVAGQAYMGKTSSVGNNEAINIQNPYIKLLYCQKN